MSFVEKFGNKSQANNKIADAAKKEPAKNAIEELAQKKKQSSVEAAAKSANADLVYLVKGIDDNRNAWYYVLVERLKVSLFLKALNNDIIHLENYGKILYSAYGDHPPQEITDKIKEEFGVSEE